MLAAQASDFLTVRGRDALKGNRSHFCRTDGEEREQEPLLPHRWGSVKTLLEEGGWLDRAGKEAEGSGLDPVGMWGEGVGAGRRAGRWPLLSYG